jgi:hypothetical protein
MKKLEIESFSDYLRQRENHSIVAPRKMMEEKILFASRARIASLSFCWYPYEDRTEKRLTALIFPK